MSRPYDWSPLGLAGDPTPGDPVVVRAGGVHYRDVSGSLGRATATMEVMDAGVSSGSQSVAALLEGSVELAAQIGKAKARYQAAGDALVPGVGDCEVGSVGGGREHAPGGTVPALGLRR